MVVLYISNNQCTPCMLLMLQHCKARTNIVISFIFHFVLVVNKQIYLTYKSCKRPKKTFQMSATQQINKAPTEQTLQRLKQERETA